MFYSIAFSQVFCWLNRLSVQTWQKDKRTFEKVFFQRVRSTDKQFITIYLTIYMVSAQKKNSFNFFICLVATCYYFLSILDLDKLNNDKLTYGFRLKPIFDTVPVALKIQLASNMIKSDSQNHFDSLNPSCHTLYIRDLWIQPRLVIRSRYVLVFWTVNTELKDPFWQ